MEFTFGKQKPRRRDAKSEGTRRVVAWLRDRSKVPEAAALIEELGGPELATMTAAEVECNVPGCAPIEVVVTVLCEGQNMMTKILKPIAEVKLEELRAAVAELRDPLQTVPEEALDDAREEQGSGAEDVAAVLGPVEEEALAARVAEIQLPHEARTPESAENRSGGIAERTRGGAAAGASAGAGAEDSSRTITFGLGIFLGLAGSVSVATLVGTAGRSDRGVVREVHRERRGTAVYAAATTVGSLMVLAMLRNQSRGEGAYEL